MSRDERTIRATELKVGMYVCRLDRDWLGTPFPLQGVRIRDAADIALVSRYADEVVIDIERGRAAWAAPPETRPGRTPGEIEAMQGQQAHADSVGIEEEVPQAREAQRQVAEFAKALLDDVRSGVPISHERVRGAVAPMVQSILRNADAFMWLETLRERGGYDYGHALNCSALLAMFGRHVGFPQDILLDMAGGGLLLDVGKLRVPDGLLDRPGPLDADEQVQARGHVEHSLAIVDEDPQTPLHVRDMIAGHHERHDGSGYPRGLAGNEIPLLARIAGMIDAYDAMSSDRAHRRGVARHEALQELYRLRGGLFAAEMVEQFLQCMGVYPTGSLVELNSGEVGVVMGQNMARRLRPKVMVLTDPDKRLTGHFRMLDLMMQGEGADAPVEIVGILPPGAHGLDPVRLFL